MHCFERVFRLDGRDTRCAGLRSPLGGLRRRHNLTIVWVVIVLEDSEKLGSGTFLGTRTLSLELWRRLKRLVRGLFFFLACFVVSSRQRLTDIPGLSVH